MSHFDALPDAREFWQERAGYTFPIDREKHPETLVRLELIGHGRGWHRVLITLAGSADARVFLLSESPPAQCVTAIGPCGPVANFFASVARVRPCPEHGSVLFVSRPPRGAIRLRIQPAEPAIAIWYELAATGELRGDENGETPGVSVLPRGSQEGSVRGRVLTGDAGILAGGDFGHERSRKR